MWIRVIPILHDWDWKWLREKWRQVEWSTEKNAIEFSLHSFCSSYFPTFFFWEQTYLILCVFSILSKELSIEQVFKNIFRSRTYLNAHFKHNSIMVICDFDRHLFVEQKQDRMCLEKKVRIALSSHILPCFCLATSLPGTKKFSQRV